MQSKLDEVHQHLAAKPATANDVDRPQPSAQRLGSVPISRPETARWRSRMSSSSALALFTFAATRLHSISARSSRARIQRGVHQARHRRQPLDRVISRQHVDVLGGLLPGEVGDPAP